MLLWSVASQAWASPVEVRVRQKGDAAPLRQAELRVDGAPAPLDERAIAVLNLQDGTPATLVVTSFDHKGQTITVTPPLDKPVVVYLERLAEPGEIVVEAFRPRSDMTRHHVDAEMAYETPGTYDDAVRLVQALPGVNIQREYAPSSGDVSVRGSLPGDNRYYLDGVEVPYLYHYDQYASVFPASMLDSLDLYSSGFGAKYGDSTGAIVEAVTDTERPDDVTGHAAINMVMAGFDLKIPLKKRWWIGTSARRSFHDIAVRDNPQFPLWPSFYDFTLRAENTRDQDGFGIFASGAGDRYIRAVGELDLLDPVSAAAEPQLTYDRNYQVLGFRYTWPRGRVVSAVIHDDIQAAIPDQGRLSQRTVRIPTRADAHGTIGSKLTWEAGLEVIPEALLATVEDAGNYGPLVTTEAPQLAWGIDKEGTALRTNAAAYAELHAALGPVRLMPGVRVGVDTTGWAPTIEPRLAARFRLAEQTELRVGGGRYQQRPESVQLFHDATLPTTSSWQGNLGLDQTIAGRVEISAEGYVKWMDDVVWQPLDGPPAIADHGLAYGAELTVRYRMRETFFLWAWFSYGHAELQDDEDGTFLTRADQPFSGGIVASWNITPKLNLALRYRAASGLPFTNIEGSVYDGTNDTWQPRYGSPFSDRMPFYQKIDLHLGYTFIFRKWSLAASLDVWIVPPGSTQLYPTWNYDYTEQGWVEGPVVLPLVGLRASF